MKLPLLFCLSAVLAAQTVNYPFVLKPLAGTSNLGDGAAATQAILKSPSAVVAEAGGGFAILDAFHQQIRRVAADGTISTIATLNTYCTDLKIARDGTLYLVASAQVFKISPTGVVTPVAGTGVVGSSADGVPAATARLAAAVSGLALDAAGNVYFAEGHRVRQVTTAGILRTIAGTGTAGFNGDSQPATSAQLNTPRGVAVDAANNVYITDRSNRRVRKVNSAGVITTVVGNGTLASPASGTATLLGQGFVESITVDGSGTIYFTEIGFGTIVKVDSAGALTKLAGGNRFTFNDGIATSNYLHGLSGIAVDAAGNVLFAEADSHRVRQIANGNIRTVAGRIRFAGDGGPATAAILNDPTDLAFDGLGNLIISDAGSYRIRRVGLDGIINSIAGNGLPGLAAAGSVANSTSIPYSYAIATDRRGNLFFSSRVLVYRIAPTGILSIYAGTGEPGNTGDNGPAIAARFTNISGLAVDAAGNLYIADHGHHRVRRVALDGTVTAFAGTGVAGAAGDNGPATAAQFNASYPMHVTFDGRGNLYVGDGNNFKVRMVSPAGIITTVAGNGTLGVAVDGAAAIRSSIEAPFGLAADDTALYIASGSFIYRVEGGVIRAISGGGVGAPTNDALATASRGFLAAGMRLDANGDLLTTDLVNGVVRKLVMNSPREAVAADGNNQTAPVRSALPKALKVQVNGRGGLGVAGLPVSFAVTSGTATLSSASVRTDATGAASVTVTTGSVGRVTIAATAAGLPPVSFAASATALPLTVDPATLTFAYVAGDEARPEAQILTLGSAGVSFTVSATVEGEVSWLVAELVEGTVKVSVANLEQLAPGTYLGTVSVNGTDAAPASIVIPVELTIAPAP